MDAEMAQEAEIRRSLSGSFRQCRGSKGTYPVLRKITLTGSTILTLADISSNAPFSCSHTTIFSLCLILQIYLVRSVPVKGFVGRVGAHRRGHVIKTVGLLLITALSPPLLLHTKKIQFAGFRFSYIIAQCGNVAGLVSLLCLLYE